MPRDHFRDVRSKTNTAKRFSSLAICNGAVFSVYEIVEEFGGGFRAGNQEVVAGASASDVQKLALGVVDLFEVGFVGDGFDALLERDDFVVAGHHHVGTEFV